MAPPDRWIGQPDLGKAHDGFAFAADEGSMMRNVFGKAEREVNGRVETVSRHVGTLERIGII